MRFVGKQPQEGINVSKTHPLAEASLLVVGLGILFVVIVVVLLFLVEISLRFVSVEKEAALFNNWLPNDLVTVSKTDDRLVATQDLVDRLATHWPDSPYRFRVEIEDSESSNAMAFPGGLIVVTSGLLQQVESENELAFVLGHELGHFYNRDHIRALGRGIVISLVFVAATGGDAGTIGLAATDLTVSGFSRKQESRADAVALQLVNAEYAHVDEAWRLFERWRDASSHDYAISYFSTHPATENRIAELRELADLEGWSTVGNTMPLAWDQ